MSVAVGCPRCCVWYSAEIAPAFCANCGLETIQEGDPKAHQRRGDPTFDAEALHAEFQRVWAAWHLASPVSSFPV